VKGAQEEAEKEKGRMRQEMEEMRRVFEASFSLACRQGVEKLKQRIEKELFEPELNELIGKEMADPHLIARMISAFIEGMESKGVEEDFGVLIPKGVSPRAITALLVSKVLDKLEGQTVSLGDFGGGVQVKIRRRQITVDMTDRVVKEMVAQYIRTDMRNFIFNV
jgi:V/A-type H+-transporting ATPase subunit E